MSDKELLGLAAKAAGLRLFIWGAKGAENYCIKNADGSPGDRWNPLTDDGDALRLAVKLEMMIDYIDRGYMAGHVLATAGPVMLSIYEPREPDPYAATRRAITRAAAEIAKTMENQNV
jgi:hypothetical protein